MPDPAVATIVVAYESAAELPQLLRSLGEQLEPGDELVVVDNASGDGSAELARAVAPHATVVPLETNEGFAGGCHAGVRASSAPLLFFCNPDATLHPDCLAHLREAASRQPRWGVWQALVLLPGGERVNSAGNVAHWLGMGWAGGLGTPAGGVAPAPHEVPFASGAALVVRREAWDAVGGFDAGYFMYGEDLDLSLRLRLAGWGVGIVPEACVEHEYSFDKGPYKWFFLERNRVWTVLAAYPPALLALAALPLLAFEVALLLVAGREGWLRPKLRAQRAVLATLPRTFRRRRLVQRQRRISAGEFAARLSASLDSPHLATADSFPLLVHAQAAYWALVRRLLNSRPA